MGSGPRAALAPREGAAAGVARWWCEGAPRKAECIAPGGVKSADEQLQPTPDVMRLTRFAALVALSLGVASYTTVNDRTVSIGAFGMVFVIQPSRE